MKSIKKKLSSSSKAQLHETPLISNSPENPSYISTSSVSSTGDAAHSTAAHDKNSNYGSTSSVFFRPSSPTSPNWETPFAKPTKQDPQWVKDAKEQSTRDPVINPADITFGLVTVTMEDSWLSGFWQSAVLLVIFVCLPSVLFAIVGLLFVRCAIIPNLGRSLSEKRKLHHVVLVLVVGIVLSLFKDSVIAMAVIYSLFKVPVSVYEILYAIIVFFSLLLFAVVPMLIFGLSGAQFSYSANAAAASAKTAPSKAKKLAESFMKENFESIHMVASLKDQFRYLKKCVPRSLVMIFMVSAAILSILRTFTPWLMLTKDTNNTGNMLVNITINNTLNATISNETLSITQTPVIESLAFVLSALNAVTVSLLLSCVFVLSISWQIIMRNVWKCFSRSMTERNDLISAGSDGIEAWWRVYQTARFLTWSSSTPAGFLRFFLQIYFMVAIAVLSIFLFSRGSIADGTQKTTVCLIVIDNILLVVGIGVSWAISLLSSNAQSSLIQHLSLLRLNMAHELRKYTSVAGGENERPEGEFHIHLKKFKGRKLRASLQVLQEMVPVVKELESNSMSATYIIVLLLIMLLGVISSAISIKKLMKI